MADLRIVDAPVLLQESITDNVKMPTGGLGNYAIRLGDLVWYVITKEQLASKSYVDNSSNGVRDELDSHIANKNNPHRVTKEQVGLGNVDNTSDVDKPVSNAVSSAIITATTDMATKAYVNQKDNLKADKATTLNGYGINDAYTKDEIDDSIALKADTTYVDGKDGDLTTLVTTDKTNLVTAINEVYDSTKDVVALYDKNVAAGTGANGWTDVLVTTQNGRTQRQKNLDTVNLLDYMTASELIQYSENYKSVDVKDAFSRAVFAANSLNLKLNAFGKFYTTQTLYLYCDADLSAATLEYDSKNGVALKISNLDESTLSRKDIKAFKVVNINKGSADNWVGLDNTGVQTVNLNTCNIYIPYVINFNLGVHKFATSNRGNCYSNITLGQIQNNKVNILFSTDMSNAWVNENNFFGGRLGYSSNEGNLVTGTRQIKIEASPNVINNNRFYGTSLEGNTPEYTVENSGTSNLFFFCRWEATSPKILYKKDDKGGVLTSMASQATRNTVQGGYQSDSITEVQEGSGGGFLNNKIGANRQIRRLSSSSGGDRYQNTTTEPIMSFFPPSANLDTSDVADATFKLSALAIACKNTGDVFDRILLNSTNGRIYLGNGSVDAISYIYGTSSSIYTSNHFSPLSSSDLSLGLAANRWDKVFLKGGVGFFNATPPTSKPSVTGSRGGNAALASLITALASYGLITDNTTA